MTGSTAIRTRLSRASRRPEPQEVAETSVASHARFSARCVWIDRRRTGEFSKSRRRLIRDMSLLQIWKARGVITRANDASRALLIHELHNQGFWPVGIQNCHPRIRRRGTAIALRAR